MNEFGLGPRMTSYTAGCQLSTADNISLHVALKKKEEKMTAKCVQQLEAF